MSNGHKSKKESWGALLCIFFNQDRFQPALIISHFKNPSQGFLMSSTTKYGIQLDSSKLFEGTYTRKGAKLVHSTNPDIVLVIGSRSRTTRTKTPYFLLYKGRPENPIYFSSMYGQSEPNHFEVEYERVRYSLILDSDKAEMVVLLDKSRQAA
jgi:hypothetical protein